MPITIDGTGSISGLSAGGLPDLSVATADLADGAVTQAKRSEDLTRATAQTSTSGTAIDFTGIPSWAKRITVMLQGVSLTGTADLSVQIGTGGTPQATSYTSAATILGNATVTGSSTAGFKITQSMAASDSASGNITLCNVTGNVWAESGLLTRTQGGLTASAGSVSLSGALDIVRVTGGTFDAGTINILYE